MAMQMRLWHIGVAEPPCEPRQIDLEHLSMSYDEYREHEQAIKGDRPGAFVNVIQAWPTTEIHDMSGEHLPVTASVVVRWRGTAELTPLRSVRPSYRFLRPRSRENLSPAGTSHFPRPWAGHVRRAAPPDGRHGDEDIQP